MSGLVQDIRYALRCFVRTPGFTATVVLSIALGTGANLGVFSVINAALLKDVPVRDPERLASVTVYRSNSPWSFSYPVFRDLSSRQSVFSGMAASGGFDFSQVMIDGVSEDVDKFAGAAVSANYFSLLGINALVGRVFTSEDSRAPGEGAVAVISHGLWDRRFGRDPSIVGRTVTLNSVPFTIIGVTPPGFFGEMIGVTRDIWIPILMQPRLASRNLLEARTASWFRTIGRLKAGISDAQANAELTGLLRSFMAEEIAARSGSLISQASPSDYRVEVARGNQLNLLRDRVREPLALLMGAVGLVLLIACANVANLLLARGMARHREIGIRVAMGSNRLRLLKQLLTESLLLALAGGALGFVLSLWVAHGLAAYFSGGLDIRPDARIVVFTLGLSMATCLLFGLIPALRATSVDTYSLLHVTSQRHTIGRPQQRISYLLVAGQIGLSLWLLIDAGLVIRTMQNLRNADIGLARHQILTLDVHVNPAAVKGRQVSVVRSELQERLAAVPGVRAVAFSAYGPFTGGATTAPVRVPDSNVNPSGDGDVRQDYVSLNYFPTVGMTLVRGRDFEPRDLGVRPTVAVINETMARHYFGQDNPIGKMLYFPEVDKQGRYIPFPQIFQREKGVEVIGVVRDAKYQSLREAPSRVTYLPMTQSYGGLGQVQIRASEKVAAVGPLIRQVMSDTAGTLAIRRIRTMEELIDETIGQERMFSRLLAMFGLLALVLACIGLYGVMAYTVNRRTGEIGVRIAVGATQPAVVWLVIRQMLLVVLSGVFVGMLAALLSARLISAFLFGLTASDPLTLGMAGTVLLLAAAAAAWIPARRAARIDPLVALRYE